MNLSAIEYVEFHVADAEQTAARLRAEYGFRVIGRLAERPDRRGVLLGQGDIRILVTEGRSAAHPASTYVARHGDGLATIALRADDPDAALAEALERGAVLVAEQAAVSEPTRITGFGDVAHSFVRPDALLAELEPVDGDDGDDPLDLLLAIDHVAACVEAGQLEPTVRYYEQVLGFKEIFEEHIEVGGQAMNSKVVQSVSGAVTLTLLEPDTTALPGQIDDFLAAHSGPGVQHLAFRTDDIATAVRTLSARGVGFLSTPSAYYDTLAERFAHVAVPVDVLRELNVLVDQDNEGELFQIFTQTTHSRRTIFFEVIERLGALTFGSANIKALYQAVERERTGAREALA
ncbi:4-hydroxyphenylpyruvate dioxygenase [Actinokineospora iranica]|uniref:4-hydroxyphenylpyruvate dioxygenase n=1 Tax=Actinokineospora iranica TaxID=1271860 RepID=A0A1G6S1D3_9PSEU|nr:4-hydroxyphenylpyruvate dioxygenase [Actinokineospora iranica]SDD09986.1 4-hydroxyphenylpyruvate dioxygenase [Actinokineospora iranica]